MAEIMTPKEFKKKPKRFLINMKVGPAMMDTKTQID